MSNIATNDSMFHDLWRQDPETDLMENFIIKTDSYKVTHWNQYPKGTTKIVSYLEARGCTPKKKDGTNLYNYTTFFGLQYILMRHFCGRQITQFKLEQAKIFCKAHLGSDLVNEAGWQHIIDNYDGYLPLKINAVKEGTKVPLKNVLMVIENEDEKLFFLNDIVLHWLTNYSETLLSQVWYPTTICTNGSHARDILIEKQKKTCDTVFVDYGLHDFGFRGTPEYMTSCLGGMAHLVNFNGTDTMPAIVLANKVYNANFYKHPSVEISLHKDGTMNLTMFGASVVATEHSTTTSWGRWGERDCVLNILRTFPNVIKSIVGDSYDIDAFATMLHADAEIKELILNDGPNGKLVLRPDSGFPPEEDCRLMQNLWDGFGGHVNTKGYKVLNPKIGLIQGDGIDLQMLIDILEAVVALGFATSNIVFGSGGGLLQKFDRDTLKFAIKCNFAVINGEFVDVQKSPKGAGSYKKSKAGRLALMLDENGVFYTKEHCTEEESVLGYLEPVFRIGHLIRFQDFEEVRSIARTV